MKKILLIAFLVLCMTGIYLYFTKQICEFEGKRRLCPKDLGSLCNDDEEGMIFEKYPPIVECYPKGSLGSMENKEFIDNSENKAITNE